MPLLLRLLVVLSLGFLAGCAAVGPRTVPADRFDYNEAIAHSAREQMLLNLVRMQYWDFPSFLAVSSVITSYSYEGGAGIDGEYGFHDPTVNKLTADANIHYTEHPTITYTPISGHEFIRRMLVPIPVRTLFAMAQSGWSVVCCCSLPSTESMTPQISLSPPFRLQGRLNWDASGVRMWPTQAVFSASSIFCSP